MFNDPFIIAGLILVSVSAFAYFWFIQGGFPGANGQDDVQEATGVADQNEENGPREPPEDLGSVGDVRLLLPEEMPHQSRFVSDGVETLGEIRDLGSLSEVHGIGTSRSEAVYHWFEESDLQRSLPDRLDPSNNRAENNGDDEFEKTVEEIEVEKDYVETEESNKPTTPPNRETKEGDGPESTQDVSV